MTFFQRIIIMLSLALAANLAHSAGLLTPIQNQQDPIELSEHHVNVIVEDGYAITTVTQIFVHEGSTNIEALYSFPVPDKGAVGSFSVWIDDKPVVGEVVKKERAREIYRAEKSNGRQVGITEQNGFKTFETRVYPVKPNQPTKVELRYYQPVNIDLGIGRWVYQLEDGGVDEAAMSFWKTNSKIKKAFSFNLHLRSAYPIEALRLPNHSQASITQISDQEWKVSLVSNSQSSAPLPPAQNNEQKDPVLEEIEQTFSETQEQISETSYPSSGQETSVFSLDQDLVVYWRLKDGLPGSIDLMTYKPNENKPGTFMMVFTPGEELTPLSSGGDWNFVLDISGSMTTKFSALVEGVSRAIENMRPDDRFRIILFNKSSTELTNGYVYATPESVKHYLSLLRKVSPNEGTNLYAGLKNGLNQLDADRASAVILVTDGVANVGQTKKQAFFELMENHDVRLFTFVMGNSANRPLLEPLARRSGGFALSVSNSDDIIGRVVQAKEKLSHGAFHDISVDIKGIKTSNITPRQPGNLYRGQQLIVMGHYMHGGSAEVKFKTKLSGTTKVSRTTIDFANKSNRNPELERLWAFASIQDLGERMEDFAGENYEQAITDIALENGLVTNYTSMLVLEPEQYDAYNIARNNKQRVSIESEAAKTRARTPIKSNRADKTQPMYKNTRPASGGSGSFSWFLIFGLMGLVWLAIKSD